jgi:prostaglandin-H2 D-isomerase / glutathione transferase
MVASIKLTYFDIEGIAESIRLALALSGTDYVDERISFAEWPAIKDKMPYRKIPVMTINDGPKCPQSKALLRWVATEYSETLYPREKLLDIETAIGVMDDLNISWWPAFQPHEDSHPEGFLKTTEGKNLIKKLREKFTSQDLPMYVKYITDLLKKNGGKWLASNDEPTIADCYAVPMLRNFTRGHLDYVPTSCLDSSPEIVDYIQRFCALEQVKGRYNNGIY